MSFRLPTLQTAWRELVQEPEVVAATDPRLEKLDIAGRFDVYSRAYFIRLRDALGGDYEQTIKYIGAANFNRLLEDFLSRLPSRSPNLGDLGSKLPAFAAEHALASQYPALADLTLLEWLVCLAGYAPDPTHEATPEQAATVLTDPDPRLYLRPSVRHVSAPARLTAIWQNPKTPLAKSYQSSDPERACVLVVRTPEDLEVLALNPAASGLLDFLAVRGDAGALLSEMLEQLPADITPEEVQPLLAELIRTGALLTQSPSLKGELL